MSWAFQTSRSRLRAASYLCSQHGADEKLSAGLSLHQLSLWPTEDGWMNHRDPQGLSMDPAVPKAPLHSLALQAPL